jgi:hypothetical protein
MAGRGSPDQEPRRCDEQPRGDVEEEVVAGGHDGECDGRAPQERERPRPPTARGHRERYADREGKPTCRLGTAANGL